MQCGAFALDPESFVSFLFSTPLDAVTSMERSSPLFSSDLRPEEAEHRR